MNSRFTTERTGSTQDLVEKVTAHCKSAREAFSSHRISPEAIRTRAREELEGRTTAPCVSVTSTMRSEIASQCTALQSKLKRLAAATSSKDATMLSRSVAVEAIAYLSQGVRDATDLEDMHAALSEGQSSIAQLLERIENLLASS